ncbi:MAG: hypothetical protein ACLQNE_00280 [Thermoguttaceae bacterium]
MVQDYETPSFAAAVQLEPIIPDTAALKSQAATVHPGTIPMGS